MMDEAPGASSIMVMMDVEAPRRGRPRTSKLLVGDDPKNTVVYFAHEVAARASPKI